MRNNTTVTDALVIALRAAVGGTSVIQSIQLAFAIRKLMNRWLANESKLDEVLKYVYKSEQQQNLLQKRSY